MYLKTRVRACNFFPIFFSYPFSQPFSASLRTQSECGKMWYRITPNTGTFHAVCSLHLFSLNILLKAYTNTKT